MIRILGFINLVVIINELKKTDGLLPSILVYIFLFDLFNN